MPMLLVPHLQVELADVIVVNKTDLAPPAELDRLQSMLRALNPGAQLLRVRSLQSHTLPVRTQLPHSFCCCNAAGPPCQPPTDVRLETPIRPSALLRDVCGTQSVRCEVDLTAVLDSRRFDASKASMAAGWQQVVSFCKRFVTTLFKPTELESRFFALCMPRRESDLERALCAIKADECCKHADLSKN